MDNIPPEHFNYILLPNTQNSDILNIYLFYRHELLNANFFNTLDLKKLVYRLFEIPDHINCSNYDYLSNIQKELLRYNFNNFTQEEQYKLKWLLYDCKNVNGKLLLDSPKNIYDFYSQGELYVYFTDKSIQYILNDVLKTNTLGFLENDDKTIKYLKLINKSDYTKCTTFHKFVMARGKVEQYTKKTNEVIDHIQKAPKYFYDFNYWTNHNNVLKNNSHRIKNLIYCKIIESWIANNRLKLDIERPQFNNCFYNLKHLDSCTNRTIKQKMIDQSNIIYPHVSKYNMNKMFITFYFPKSKKLKVKNTYKSIVALSIIYDLNTLDYTGIVCDLKNNIFNSTQHMSYDQNLNYHKLFEYIKGKDILYMIENKKDITQQGILTYKDFFDEKTNNVEKIINYYG